MTFAEQLLIERRRACVSQTNLAELLGVSVRTVGYWESGEVVPREFIQRAALESLAKLPERGPKEKRSGGVVPEALMVTGIDWASVDWEKPPFQIAQQLGVSLSVVLKNKPAVD